MDKVEISKIVDCLDSAVSKESAHFAIYTYGGGADESFTQGNTTGYLRYGIEFLKAGLRITEDNKDETHAELDYLINEDSDFHCHYFKVSDEPQADEYKRNWKDDLLAVVVIGCLVLILFMAFIGVITIVRYLVAQAFG